MCLCLTGLLESRDFLKIHRMQIGRNHRKALSLGPMNPELVMLGNRDYPNCNQRKQRGKTSKCVY